MRRQASLLRLRILARLQTPRWWTMGVSRLTCPGDISLLMAPRGRAALEIARASAPAAAAAAAAAVAAAGARCLGPAISFLLAAAARSTNGSPPRRHSSSGMTAPPSRCRVSDRLWLRRRSRPVWPLRAASPTALKTHPPPLWARSRCLRSAVGWRLRAAATGQRSWRCVCGRRGRARRTRDTCSTSPTPLQRCPPERWLAQHITRAMTPTNTPRGTGNFSFHSISVFMLSCFKACNG